jgi:hypothetical protein
MIPSGIKNFDAESLKGGISLISTTTLIIFFGFMAAALILIAVMKIKSIAGSMDAGDFIQSLALGAVKHAGFKHKAGLDFSMDSIHRIDWILQDLHKRHAAGRLSGKEARSEANIWGAYVGETVRRLNGGKWESRRGSSGENIFVLMVNEGKTVNPFDWCYDRITQGDSEPVTGKCRDIFQPDHL